MILSFDIKFIKRDQKQCRNGQALDKPGHSYTVSGLA